MIGRIAGTLLEKTPPHVLVDCGGVGYELDVPMSTLYNLPNPGEKVSLFTQLIVREGGFVDAGQYRAWLLENFNITTSVQADQATRASIINALKQRIRENQSTLSLEEMAEEAAIENNLRQQSKGE